ncbi:hypothetical protein QE152_g9832 [Popillia japonica]|uniref:Defective in cullin neddylation protein n=1 Tax=Popillia japonica TaxID=7064 RepID=A0AAW1LW50_POPJA
MGSTNRRGRQEKLKANEVLNDIHMTDRMILDFYDFMSNVKDGFKLSCGLVLNDIHMTDRMILDFYDFMSNVKDGFNINDNIWKEIGQLCRNIVNLTMR